MSVVFAPQDETVLFVGRRHERHVRSDEEKLIAQALKARMRRSRSLSSERNADAARERAAHLARQARRNNRRASTSVEPTPTPQEATVFEDSDSLRASPGQLLSFSERPHAREEFNFSKAKSEPEIPDAMEDFSFTKANSEPASASFGDRKDRNPKVPWRTRFIEGSRALLDRVKLRGRSVRSRSAVAPACARGEVEEQDGPRQPQEVQAMKTRQAERRFWKLPRGKSVSRAVLLEGPRSDVFFASS
eukprot:TRINITY_DN54449_c0_g1_i1.p1 TRINITY_DN54449_c0_g1~~TRINITY_DN54449_c0_g1_i1.p1  ORF type:complete len:247 (-),score=36.81 TRINITY_DN54449_c0_g1_i1:312-1052(-)